MTDAMAPMLGIRDVDPRVERSRTVILSAALELLGEIGYGGLTIEAVATRAGVGKSTIYRHWTGKLDLVEDAIRTLKTGIVLPAGGTLRDRVIALLRLAAASMAQSTWSTCLPAIIDAAERDPEVLAIHRRIASERRQQLIDLLTEGVAGGEIAPRSDLALLADCLVGPMIVRRLLLHDPLLPDAVPALVDQVLGGVKPAVEPVKG
ncbi:MAG: TetR/AcrR family transcriptional regulator [Acidimicrobiales bacterium]